MDIFEAITIFHTPFPWQREQDRKNTWQRWQDAEKISASYETYLPLTIREGRAIAMAAIELFDVGVVSDFEYLPHIILTNVASVIAGALHGLHSRLLERNLHWGNGILYREADPGTRDQLFALLETDLPDDVVYDDLLCALAWIGDEKVQEQFHVWRQHSPAWSAAAGYSIQEYAHHAGWELTEEGKRRELCFQANYDFMSVETASSSHLHRPVAVVAPRKDHCAWCARPLVTLFDLQLRNRRLAFLNSQEKRLRIPFCINCSFQKSVFFDIDGEGKANWSEDNDPAPDRMSQHKSNFLPELRLVLGKARKTPYIVKGSHLGGYPAWVQSPQYPCCLSCGQTMPFFGQLEPTDIGASPSLEGIVYAFVCTSCGKATTCYQQT